MARKTPKLSLGSPSRSSGTISRPGTASKYDDIELPDAPPDIKHFSLYPQTLFGEKGVGKSSLAAKIAAEGCKITAGKSGKYLHMMWEFGRQSLRSPFVPNIRKKEPPLDWPRGKAYFAKVLEDDSITHVIIDSLDECANYCEKFHAAKRGVDTLNGINDHGRAWGECKADFRNEIQGLLFSNKVIILTSHVRKRPMVMRSLSREELKENPPPDMVQPTAPGWAWEEAKILTEFAWFYGYLGTERALYVRGSEALWASTPFEEHFLQPHASEYYPDEPLDILPMGRSPTEAYNNLCLAWDNKLDGYFHDSGE